jgi:hypothetical protein
MDAYVDRHGKLPLYLWAVMSSDLGQHSLTYRTAVRVKTVMDEESLQTDRRWSVDLRVIEERREDRILRDVDLDFSSSRAYMESYEKLREVFNCAAQLSTPGIRWAKPDTKPPEEVAEALMDRFGDMHRAVEAAMRNDEPGDFAESSDDKIVVDVEYDRSTFSARHFKDYFRSNFSSNTAKTVDADIRVTDNRKKGRGETYWSLYRKDGVWGVVTATEEAANDYLTPTAEDVRSHVYWHVIREINVDDQEQAFAKSTFAADLFTTVEDELALFNAGAPQPR